MSTLKAPWLTLSGSNYPYIERIPVVPKMFESLKFDPYIERIPVVPKMFESLKFDYNQNPYAETQQMAQW